MKLRKPVQLLFLCFALLALNSCTAPSGEAPVENQATQAEVFEAERTAILTVLNNETKAAFQRDYSAWRENWVRSDYVTKSYLNFPDSSMTETLGWEEVDEFVRTYIETHPEPVPLPDLLSDIDVRLYGTGAWISYEQNDPEYGRKRETRLMEKVDGQWRIANMHTTIYGFEE